MAIKRILLAAALIYALLSLAAPHLLPIRVIEVSTLVVARPWESLFSIFFGRWSAVEPAAGSWRDPEAVADDRSALWWKPVLEPLERLPAQRLLAGRVVHRFGSGRTRLSIAMGPVPPVRPGDPLVYGSSLIGFVARIDPSSTQVEARLLSDRSSRVIAAEIGEGIAGGAIECIVGGATRGAGSAANRTILLEYPSTRFGLSQGARVITSSRFNPPDIPPGLLLGSLTLRPSDTGEARSRAGVLPPFPSTWLERLAVLVPCEREGVTGRHPVPDLRVARQVVMLARPPGFLSPTDRLRVNAGMETGCAPGDLLCSEGFLVGRLERVGLWTSVAEYFLAEGRILPVVFLTLQGPEPNDILVVEREDGVCRVRARHHRAGLAGGEPLFLGSESCSGAEIYPLCRVEDPGDGQAFTVRCADLRHRQRGIRLSFVP